MTPETANRSVRYIESQFPEGPPLESQLQRFEEVGYQAGILRALNRLPGRAARRCRALRRWGV